MSETILRRFFAKRVLLVVVVLFGYVLLFAVSCRIAVQSIFRGIETSRTTGLAAVATDYARTWSSGYQFSSPFRSSDKSSDVTDWVSRSADLRTRSASFNHSVEQLHRIVSAHHAYFEDLRTESRPKLGRMLYASISVPSAEFDRTLADLKMIGRVEAIGEAGEDSAVKVASAARHVARAQTNLTRLQRLQRERKGGLRDALALEKEISQANESVAEAERQHEDLLTTVAQAHIQLTLLEDYRAPLDTNFAEAALQVRNSLVEGVGAIFSSGAVFVGVALEYGLPILFWLVLLFLPARYLWRRFRPQAFITAKA